ncbi:MAG: aldehyde dehydrogenase family protein [Terracidiphilus sp.]|jgi:acyl-CoA reductase-like NAD-dependent aldehyde dehydrogenase
MKMRPGTQTGFLLCGKEWTEGEALEVRSPWDQGLVGRVTIATRADARQAVHHAVASLRRTRALPRWKRREILEDVAAALIEQKERFAQLIVAEAGKPVRLARAEVDRAILTFKTAAEVLSQLGGESIPLDLMEGNEGRWGLVQRFSVGPVLAITPFNFPLNLVSHKVAPALAAGCPVILKPSSQTPFTALALGEVILKAGWPVEALAVLPLSNADTAWLAEKEDSIKLVSFTGSAKVGWELKAHSGRKRVLLELGGNAALIVCADWPDLDEAAVRTARGAFGNAGQSCVSVQRVFVERDIYQTFLWKVVEAAARLAVGDPSVDATEVGPLIRPSDAERVDSWIKEAVKGGAKLVAGGERRGSVVTPAILTGTTPGMMLRDEEAFGPVVAIEPFDDFEEALACVNHSKYGLQAGLLTRDAGRILTAYRELEVGALIVGDTPSWRLDTMPFGGVKDSGLGREGVRFAIEEMTEPRMLVMAGLI